MAQLPATTKLMSDAQVEENAAAKAAKDRFQRNRPLVVDPGLHSCTKGDKPRPSYPSGLATMGFSMAVILARLGQGSGGNVRLNLGSADQPVKRRHGHQDQRPLHDQARDDRHRQGPLHGRAAAERQGQRSQ